MRTRGACRGGLLLRERFEQGLRFRRGWAGTSGKNRLPARQSLYPASDKPVKCDYKISTHQRTQRNPGLERLNHNKNNDRDQRQGGQLVEQAEKPCRVAILVY